MFNKERMIASGVAVITGVTGTLFTLEHDTGDFEEALQYTQVGVSTVAAYALTKYLLSLQASTSQTHPETVQQPVSLIKATAPSEQNLWEQAVADENWEVAARYQQNQ